MVGVACLLEVACSVGGGASAGVACSGTSVGGGLSPGGLTLGLTWLMSGGASMCAGEGNLTKVMLRLNDNLLFSCLVPFLKAATLATIIQREEPQDNPQPSMHPQRNFRQTEEHAENAKNANF